MGGPAERDADPAAQGSLRQTELESTSYIVISDSVIAYTPGGRMVIGSGQRCG